MAQYQNLAPFPENVGVLAALQRRGMPTGVLSNGDPDMLAVLIAQRRLFRPARAGAQRAGTGHFKTDPAAYALGPQALNLPAGEILFVSSNCWDAIGATWYGYTTLWVNRPGLPLEPLETQPTRIGSSLRDVLGFLLSIRRTLPMSLALPQGMQINAPILPGFEAVLTKPALELVARLHRTFEPRRQRAARRARRARRAARRRRAPRLPRRDAGHPRRRLEDRADPAGAAVPARRDHRPGRGEDGHQRVQLGRRFAT